MVVDGAPGCIGSFLRLKAKHSHLKLILSIGGGAGSQNFAAVAATAVTRDNFGRSVKGMVDATGFDGIDSKFLEWTALISNILVDNRVSTRLCWYILYIYHM